MSLADRVTLREALLCVSKILTIYFFLPEFYFLVLGITLVVFASQLFMVPGVDYGPFRPVVFVVSSLVASFIPMLLAFVTLLPHMLWRVNIWGLTLLNVGLSAPLFSAIQPFITEAILEEGLISYARLIWPVLIFYFFAEFYMLMRLNPVINFTRYVQRHASDGIEKFIPADKLGPLVSLSAQDHYVEIITTKGAHLERMTMKKAVELVGQEAGMQVHRSHWVAYGAILDLEKSGERYAVLLRNGARLPVGKSKVAGVQAFLERR